MTTNTLIEKPTRFLHSKIWALEADYFQQMGIDAWRLGEVPHYVSNNRSMGLCYSALIQAFFNDMRQNEQSDITFIVELGAGTGRLAYHILTELSQSPINHPFVYVMTDYAEKNIAFWQQHPLLQPFIQQGILDFARFDIANHDSIQLIKRGICLKPHSLTTPVIGIANYLFDAIPQDLIYIKEQKASQVLLQLNGEHENSPINELQLKYTYQDFDSSDYDYPMQRILAEYLQSYEQPSHVLFPVIGLNCLRKLHNLSKQGLMLLTADKGQNRLETFHGRQAPKFSAHGHCFSLTVNYYAIKRYVEYQGGVALFPAVPHHSINVGCLLWLHQNQPCTHTVLAYQKQVNHFGPDHFFSIKKHIEQQLDELSLRSILAYLHLSAYDARLCWQCLPRLRQLTDSMTPDEITRLMPVMFQVWQHFYPIGESWDLAAGIADVFLQLALYDQALHFLQYSTQLHGDTPQTALAIAHCQIQLGHYEPAQQQLQKILNNDPDNEKAKQLLALLE